MKRNQPIFILITLLLFIAFIPNVYAIPLSNTPLLYDQFTQHFPEDQILGTFLDTYEVAPNKKIYLESEVRQGEDNGTTVFAYTYQLGFPEYPGPYAGHDISFGVGFGYQPYPVELGAGVKSSFWGKSEKGNLWPKPVHDLNAPLSAEYFPEKEKVAWLLPPELNKVDGQALYFSAPMIVLSEGSPEQVTAALVTKDDLDLYETLAIFHKVVGPGAPANVPEPATMLLLGIGLVGLAGLRRLKLIKV